MISSAESSLIAAVASSRSSNSVGMDMRVFFIVYRITTAASFFRHTSVADLATLTIFCQKMAYMMLPDEMDKTEARFKDHLALAQVIALEYFNIPRGLPEEALAEAQLALWRAANAYNPERGEFPPYASRAIRNALNTLYAKQLKMAEVFPQSLDDSPNWGCVGLSSSSTVDVSPKSKLRDHKQDVRKKVQWEETSTILSQVLDRLNLRERIVIDAIKSGHSFSEIGLKLSVSKQSAHKIAATALEKVKKYLEEIGFTGLDTAGLLRGESQARLG
jgi:RNA polymerase sigma factor (sigma-70 family)